MYVHAHTNRECCSLQAAGFGAAHPPHIDRLDTYLHTVSAPPTTALQLDSLVGTSDHGLALAALSAAARAMYTDHERQTAWCWSSSRAVDDESERQSERAGAIQE